MIEYKPEHVLEIMEAGAKEPGFVVSEANIKFAHEIADGGPCATGTYDGKVVSCGGISIVWPGMGEVWATNVADIGSYHINPEIAKSWIYKKIAEHRLFRLQTPLKSGFEVGILYAKWLGFEYESTMKYYHKGGEDALMYVIITEKYLEGQ